MTQGKNKLQSTFIFLGIIALVYSLVAIIALLSHSLFFITTFHLQYFPLDNAIIGAILSLLIINHNKYENVSLILGTVLLIFLFLLFADPSLMLLLFSNFSHIQKTNIYILSFEAKAILIFISLFFIFTKLKQHYIIKAFMLIFLYSSLIVSTLVIIGHLLDITIFYQYGDKIFPLPIAVILFLLSVQCTIPSLSRKKISRLSIHLPPLIASVALVLLMLIWKLIYLSQSHTQFEIMKNSAEYANSKITLNLSSKVNATRRFFDRMTFLDHSSKAMKEDINNYLNDYPSLLLLNIKNNLLANSSLKTHTQKQISVASTKEVTNKCIEGFAEKNIASQQDTSIFLVNNLLCIQDNRSQSLAIFDNNHLFEATFSSPIFSQYEIILKTAHTVLFKNHVEVREATTRKYSIAEEIYQLPVTIIFKQPASWEVLSILFSFVYYTAGGLFIIMLMTIIIAWQRSIEQRQSLQTAHQNINTILEHSPVSLLIIDHNFNINFANNAAAQLSGYSLEQLVNMHINKLIPNRFHLKHTEYMHTFFASPKSRIMGESKDIYLHPKVGSERSVEIALTPIKIENKTKVLASIIDITDRKNAESETKQYLQELTRSNQELNDFAYIASHDLKEPLRGIANFSSFLLEDYEDKLDSEGKMQLRTLGKLAKRMECLISDLLSYSRVGRGEFAIQDCNLNHIVNEKISLLGTFLKDQNAKVIVKNSLPTVRCDRSRIGEVFQNLITNGIKYNDSEQKVITIDYTETSDSYTFSVEDNGIGIEKKDFKKIFSIFKRLHAKDAYGGGTGAGMTISDKIIRRHGGEIWLTSKLGNGSIFYFSIAKNFDLDT